MTEGEKMAEAIDRDALYRLRNNLPTLGDVALMGTPHPYRKHFVHTKNGLRERVVLVNHDGFQKQELIDAGAKYWRIRSAMRLNQCSFDLDTPVVNGGLTEKVMQFERTSERTPKEGMVVYRQMEV